MPGSNSNSNSNSNTARSTNSRLRGSPSSVASGRSTNKALNVFREKSRKRKNTKRKTRKARA